MIIAHAPIIKTNRTNANKTKTPVILGMIKIKFWIFFGCLIKKKRKGNE
jgi:hypothetical protein